MIIYKTTNLINGKIYIGQTRTKSLTKYKGGGKQLKGAIKKYGWCNFKCEKIIEGNFNQVLTDELEIHYIQLYNSTNKNIGYNIEKGGRGRTYCAKKQKSTKELMSKIMLDWHKNLTEEEKAERSVNIKNAFTEERRKKYSEIMTERNKDMSQESRQKISNFHKDKIISFETREKISRSLKGKCLGKVVSEETKEKISQANTGRTASAEARLKMKVAHQKFLVKVYKKDELIGEYGYLECQTLFNISVNTIKKLKNTGIVYKEYSFIVEEMAKKKA